MNDIIILVPAYNPDEELIKLITELKNTFKIIVVNDGSKKECNNIFDKIRNDVLLLEHNVNKGKAEALKTGMEEILKKFPTCKGIVTADADGQHAVDDIVNVAKELQKEDCFILGVRDTNQMPPRSKFGNNVARFLMKVKYKVSLDDTQSGLRGMPYRYLKNILKINSDGFTFETEMLKMIFKNTLRFKQIRIKTIYANEKSNFKAIKDSFKILKSIILK